MMGWKKREYPKIASMMPEKDGGVDDPELRVYSVQNVRVVSTSIFPIGDQE
jgi:hypothetical protein